MRVGRFWILCQRAHLRSCLSCTPTKDNWQFQRYLKTMHTCVSYAINRYSETSHVGTISQMFYALFDWDITKSLNLFIYCNLYAIQLLCIFVLSDITLFVWASFSAIQLVTLSRSVLNNKVATIIILSQQLKLVWSRNSSNLWLGEERFPKLCTTCP